MVVSRWWEYSDGQGGQDPCSNGAWILAGGLSCGGGGETKH